MCKKCDKILKRIRNMAVSCIGTAEENVKLTADYQEAEGIPVKDLPKHINDPEPLRSLVAQRLKKESMLEPQLINACMSNQGWDHKDYRTIGFNDGMLCVLGELLTLAGLHDEATKAEAYMYSDQ